MRSLRRIWLPLLLLSLDLIASGCSRKPSPPAVRTYKLVGVVRKVDRESGDVTIKHEAIPGYMPAMTMPFPVRDKDLLEQLQAGDEVEGTLRVRGDAYELTGLEITRLATAPQIPVLAPGVGGHAKPLAPGEPVPDFAMTTQDGEALRLSDLRGKVVALTFIYTRCPVPDFCPLMDAKFGEMARMIRALPGWSDRVRLLSISFDPEHDSPEVLARHAKLRGAKGPLWTFAVASHEELRKVAPALGLVYGPGEGEVLHNRTAAVVGQDGKLVRLATGKEGKTWTAEEFVRAMRPYVTPSRK
jgi:protein SCO1/2